MDTTLEKQTTTQDKDTDTLHLSPSRLIGPEDLTVGQYVTVAEATDEYVVRSDCDIAPELTVHAVTTMAGYAGWPSRVKAISLPYVFVIRANGSRTVFDLRRHRRALLAPEFGKAVFNAEAKASRKNKQRK
ncbi:MAG: hypothetical protein AAF663_10740 [Planctomycetota bacterium]